MRNMQLEKVELQHLQVVQFCLTVSPFTRIHWIRHRSRNRDGDFNPGHRFRAHHLVLLRFRRLGSSTSGARCVRRFAGLHWRGLFLRRGFLLLLRLYWMGGLRWELNRHGIAVGLGRSLRTRLLRLWLLLLVLLLWWWLRNGKRHCGLRTRLGSGPRRGYYWLVLVTWYKARRMLIGRRLLQESIRVNGLTGLARR